MNDSLSNHPAVLRYARYVNPTFVQLLGVFGYGRLFVRAEDVWLWDSDGRKYLDCLAGFGAVNLGHNPPAILARMREFLDERLPNVLHVGPSEHAGLLAEALARRTGGELSVSLFANSGGEAVESALKVARAATKRAPFVYCRNGYHGNELGALSVVGNARLRAPFEPLLPQCIEVPFGDLGALRDAFVAHKPAAFVVEPILGEGGVLLAPPKYLAEARSLCKQHGVVFILDEVQTGIGRTGRMFAYQHEHVEPDILVLGKALGGSLMPVSVALTNPELFERAYGSMSRFDLHGSTFAGNALACVVAVATLRAVEEQHLCDRARDRGDQLMRGLRNRLRGHPAVREVRGRGLLVGIELGAPPGNSSILRRVASKLFDDGAEKVLGQWVSVRLLERGIVCQPASQQWNVLKIEPPLTISEEQIDDVVDTVGSVLEEYTTLGDLARDVGARLGVQWLSGWRL